MLRNNFLPARSLSVFVAVLLCVAGISAQAQKFSSVYTDSKKQCKGQEPVFTCTGYGGYRLILDIGGVFQSARLESASSKDDSISLAEHQSVGWNPVVEWRMADGKPFAVILRVDVNDPTAEIPKKTGEELHITGLKGYESISGSIDAKTANANEKAREIADKGYEAAKGTGSMADAAFTSGGGSLLNADQLANLAKLNAAVAVPTWIPDGYKLTRFEIQPPEEHIIVFTLTYAGPAGQTFKIESNNEGLGDLAVKREVKGTSSFFQDTALETFDFYTGHDQNDAATVASEWLCSPKKYWPKTSKVQQCYQFLGTSRALSPADAMKVMQSLRYLKH